MFNAKMLVAPLPQALFTALLIGAGTVSAADFEAMAAQCAPQVHVNTLKRIALVESSGNPFAIGVVGAHLTRQPKHIKEALSTVYALEAKGYNFSMGLVQINRYNLTKYGESYETIFEPCRNLNAGAAILHDCYTRARVTRPDKQEALRAALSCYYSGSLTASTSRKYVHNVVAAAPNTLALSDAIDIVPDVAQGASPKPTSESTTAKGIPKHKTANGVPTAQSPANTDWFRIFAEDDDDRTPPDSPPNTAAGDP